MTITFKMEKLYELKIGKFKNEFKAKSKVFKAKSSPGISNKESLLIKEIDFLQQYLKQRYEELNKLRSQK